MATSTWKQALAEAAGQHGLISLGQLRAHEITRSQVRTAVERGRLIEAAPRVYAVVGAPESIERRQTLGLLCLGSSAVLSHEAAARLHGFDRCKPHVVEFTMPRRHHGVRVPFRVHTTICLPRIDQVTVAGFPCTSATRTVLDLARSRVPRVRLEASIDSAIRSGASSPSVLATRLANLRGPGRWGVRLLDELFVDSGGHSMLERRFLALMRQAGLQRPRTQVIHRRDGRTFARVDFLFDSHGVVVEVSGRRGHASDAERAKDAQRRNELQDEGRRVYEYTWEHVTKRPDYIVSTMQARLGEVRRLT
jgi:very-short-patch-repair endonuclease